MAIIKKFDDGSYLEYGRGSFDDWCVYYTDTNGRKSPPKDTDYFAQLVELAGLYDVHFIYNDYVDIYNLTGKDFDEKVMKHITTLSSRYIKSVQTDIDVLYSVLYMAMIAEERKLYTKLGKRIKRLGIHILLKEQEEVEFAANFMRGMNWKKIDQLCKDRGF